MRVMDRTALAAEKVGESKTSATGSKTTRKNTREAAAHVRLSESTLAKLRVYGGGPLYAKLGRSVLYDEEDLDAWVSAHKHFNTSDYVVGKIVK